MELRLENGSYVPSKLLGLDRVEGAEEVLQRVIMKLKAQKGAFFPLPDYGSRLYTLFSIKPNMRETAAKQFVQEALADEAELEMDSLEISYGDDGELRIAASFTYGGDVQLFVDTEI